MHIVGGSIENNETPEQAIKREIMEEINMKIYNITPFDFDSDILEYKGRETQFIFLRYTAEINKFPNFTGSDAKELIWLSKEELLNYKQNAPTLRLLKKLNLI